MTVALTKEERIIADQRVKIEELEEELQNFKQEFAPVTTPFPREWQLTTQQGAVLLALYKSPGTVQREYLNRVLNSQSDHVDNVLKVVMVKLRKKVQPLGIEIHNEWNVGYWMGADSRNIIRMAIAESQ